MFKIITDNAEPYGNLVRQFIQSEFPQPDCASSADVVDLITNEIFGTKNNRFGPKPNPESQVAIRDVIRHYVAQGLPIPFLVPWGSEKPDGSGVDIAELGALKMINCLQHRIQQHYAAGAHFNIRLEDVSAPHLFHENQEQARINAEHYSSGFVNLIRVLELDKFITPRRESSIVSEAAFNETADKLLPLMEQYVRAIASGDITLIATAQAAVEIVGWRGVVSQQTLDFYLGQYAKLYPNKDRNARLHILARYYSGALARHKLSIRGDSKEWNGKYLGFSFVPPIPGTDTHFTKMVYYRTLPMHLTSNHMPPWRCKGYLEIDNANTVTPKLARFDEQKDYTRAGLQLTNGELLMDLNADYVLV